MKIDSAILEILYLEHLKGLETLEPNIANHEFFLINICALHQVPRQLQS